MGRLVTLITFNYPHEAGVIRTLLESEGIQTYTANETITQVNPLFSNAVGGVQLQIEVHDLKKATDLLKEKGFDTGSPAKENAIAAWINRLMGHKTETK